MVLWVRAPCRLPYPACPFRSVARVARPAHLTCYFHHIPIISQTARYTESPNELKRGPAFVPLGVQTPHYRYSELGRGYEYEGNKDSLRYTNLGQASHASSHEPTPTDQHESSAGKDTVASPDSSAEPGGTQLTSEDAPFNTLAEELRIAMRGVAYPIAVITSGPVITDRSQEGKFTKSSNMEPEHLRGLLVSSFNTITLMPEPYISFNVKLPSRTWDAITQTKEFMVHLMWSHEVAQKFASSQPLAAAARNTAHTKPATALDELTKGRTFGLRCKLASFHKVGDHVIVVGNVLELMPRSSAPGVLSKHEHLLWKEGKWHVAKPLKNDT